MAQLDHRPAVAPAPPTLANPGPQSSQAGQDVSLGLQATSPAGYPLTYSATGLPDGLDIDASSGLISGTVAESAAGAVPASVTVTVDDGQGDTVSQTFPWEVIPGSLRLGTPPAPTSAVAGTDLSALTLATFTMSDPGSQASDFSATVDWGDGSGGDATIAGSQGSFTVTGDHTYTDQGSYTPTVTITGPAGNTLTATDAVTVTPAPWELTGSDQEGALVEQSSQFVLGLFKDTNPYAEAGSEYTVTINWGDDSADSTNVVSIDSWGEASVTGSHTYAQVGTYTVRLTAGSITAYSTVVVGNAWAGVPTTLTLSSFNDANLYGSANDFTATVAWGDGQQDSYPLVGSNGVYSLSGPLTHTYAVDSFDQPNGAYQVQVTVKDGTGGNTLVGTDQVAVVRSPVGLAVTDLVSDSLTLSNVKVAEFTDPDYLDGSTEFSAVIHWGDDAVTNGTVTGADRSVPGVRESHLQGCIELPGYG